MTFKITLDSSILISHLIGDIHNIIGSISKVSLCILVLLLFSPISAFSQQPTDPLLTSNDILDWPSFYLRLAKDGKQASPSPVKRIWELLSGETKTTVLKIQRTRNMDGADVSRVINALNDILKRRDFYQYEDFALVAAFEAKSLLHNYRNDLPDVEIKRLNRQLIEATFPKEIAKKKVPEKKTLEEVESIKAQYEQELFKIPGVVGMGIGINGNGFVFGILVTSEEAKVRIPEMIEGIPTPL